MYKRIIAYIPCEMNESMREGAEGGVRMALDKLSNRPCNLHDQLNVYEHQANRYYKQQDRLY